MPIHLAAYLTFMAKILIKFWGLPTLQQTADSTHSQCLSMVHIVPEIVLKCLVEFVFNIRNMLVWCGVEFISKYCLEYVSTTLASRLLDKFYKTARLDLFKPSSYISVFDPLIFFYSANKSSITNPDIFILLLLIKEITFLLWCFYQNWENTSSAGILSMFMLPRCKRTLMSLF